ncbi:MAG: ATP-binding protein [Chloroflexota bacterium]
MRPAPHLESRSFDGAFRDRRPGGERSDLEQFFRTTVAKPYGEVRLGLYISREIVTKMGGDIVLESSAAGGSVFRMSLPLQRVPVTSAK